MIRGTLVLALAAWTVSAFSEYRSNIPNGFNVKRSGTQWDAVGHVDKDAGSTSRNPFGLAFASAGHTWTTGLCNADSDGDGFSNGQELGDPSCQWSSGQTPSRTTGISHPGYSDSTPSTATTAPGATTAATTTTATTTTTPAPPTTTLSVSQLGASKAASSKVDLGDIAASFQWTLYQGATASASDDIVEFQLTWSTDTYMGVGVANSEMSGPIIACYVTAASGTATCVDLDGSGTSLQAASAATASVVSGSISGSTRSVRVRSTVQRMRLSDARQRMIFAKGTWLASNFPTQHPAKGYTTLQVLPYAGTVAVNAMLDVGAYLLFYVGIGFWFVCFLLLSLVKKDGSPTFWLVVGTLSFLFVLVIWGLSSALFGMQAFASGRSGQVVSVARGFGFAAEAGLFLLLFPVARMFGMPRFLQTSFERQLPIHATLAFITWLIVTTHMSIMIDSGLLLSGLFGLFTWITMTLQILIAGFLRHKAYQVFRIVHWLLFVTIIVLGCLHQVTLLFTVIPPLFFYAVDHIMRLASDCGAPATVTEASFCESEGVTRLVLALPSGSRIATGGQFAFVKMESVGTMRHPFSYALCDETAGRAVFYVKDNGGSTWTAALGAAARGGTLNGAAVSLQGPYGRLSVDVGVTPTAVFVAGGIGITGVSGIMRDALRHPGVQELHLIWVVRKEAAALFFAPTLLEIVGDSAMSKRVAVSIFISQPTVGEKASLAMHLPGVTLSTQTGRCDAAVLARDVFPGQPTTLYLCGPAALMAAAADGLGQRAGVSLLHQETFSF